MSVFAIGLNHTTAPLALREQFAFAEHELGAALTSLQQSLGAQVALLSTCNRTELYFAPNDTDASHPSAPASPASIVSIDNTTALLSAAITQLAQLKGISPDSLAKHSYQLHASTAVRHAYRVASGLDSMVLGEPQILGQLKQAVRCAQDHGTLGTQLQHVFQQSFAVAKQVRSQTGVGAASVSMAAAAVRLSQRIFGDLSQRHVLMVGAGEMIALCATHFAGHAPKRLTIANRTPERGQALVDSLAKQGHSAQLMPLSQLAQSLHQYDIIVSCTASTLPIIGLGLVQRALAQKAAKRQAQTTMMVDLAVPRDIEPEVAKLADVYLYTVDDLGRVVQEGRAARGAAVAHAEQMIDEKISEYERWQAARRSVPLIQTIQQHAHSQRDSELDKALKQLAQGADPAQLLEQLSRQLTQKLLHASLNTAQTLAADPLVADALLVQVQQGYAGRL
jgi:glutamyl-tRNA reductase